MFGSKFGLSAIIVAALAFSAIPIAIAVDSMSGDDADGLVTISGTVKAFVCCDDYEFESETDDATISSVQCNDDDNETDDDFEDDEAAEVDDDDENETCDNCTDYDRAGAFILETANGTDILVEFGPWWYWDWVADNNGTTVRDVIAVGDRANVTGELRTEDDGSTVMEAWSIENTDTGKEITIKEEACPPWAGGPKALGINPWPPSHEDE